MHPKYNVTEIQNIWSSASAVLIYYQLWDTVVETGKQMDTPHARRSKKSRKLSVTGHELIDAFQVYADGTGYVNAHAGLTSSDITDNTRRIQMAKSMKVVAVYMKNLEESLTAFSKEVGTAACVGYTHWQPAAPTTWQRRITYWSQYFSDYTPGAQMKRFGGAVGTGAALELLGGKFFQEALHNRVNGTELAYPQKIDVQSCDFTTELYHAQFLDLLAAAMSKVATDIRFLCHTGELVQGHRPGYRGSSAMPGKNNPEEAEQIVGLCRVQPGYSRAIWDCLANNGLERTLDNSSTLRQVLPDMYNNAAYCLSKLTKVVESLQVNKKVCRKLLKQHSKRLNKELQMAQMIKDGSTWIEAHTKLTKS